MTNKFGNKLGVALLFLGSAMFIFSCGDKVPNINLEEATPTIVMDSVTMKYSTNGELSYRFTTFRLERYETPDSSYMRFNNDVFIETFDDSTKVVTSTLNADKAYYNVNKKLWIVSGNVVGVNKKEDKILYTEELYWDESSKKIYSFVRSKIVDGDQVMIGSDGFDANEDLSYVVFKKSVGRMFLDTTSNNKKDSLEIKNNTDTTKIESSILEDGV